MNLLAQGRHRHLFQLIEDFPMAVGGVLLLVGLLGVGGCIAAIFKGKITDEDGNEHSGFQLYTQVAVIGAGSLAIAVLGIIFIQSGLKASP